MNIFILDNNPKLAAQYHCDKHVVKMILESAQLLSTAHKVLDGTIKNHVSKTGRNIKRWVLDDWREPVLYVSSHVNHPCAIWVRQSIANYSWLASLAIELSSEYTNRYNKIHASASLLYELIAFHPDNIPITEGTEPPQAMPDYCKIPGDAVAAYRNYYINEKHEIAVWKYTATPDWYKKETQ